MRLRIPGSDVIKKLVCLFLGLFATGISLQVSIQTGGLLADGTKVRPIVAAVGVLTVLAAHWLLVVIQSTSMKRRIVIGCVWGGCLAYVLFSHANFFEQMQQQSGKHRVDIIDQSWSTVAPKRSLSEIFTDKAKLSAELSAKAGISCANGCRQLQARKTFLADKLMALEAEADEVKRWQAEWDRQQTLKQNAHADLVTVRLSGLLGVTDEHVGLVMAILFAVVLEGVACVCWLLVFSSRDSTEKNLDMFVTQSVTARQQESHVQVMNETASMNKDEKEVMELIQAFQDGRLKPGKTKPITVDGVQQFRRCGRKEAQILSRLGNAKLEEMAPPAPLPVSRIACIPTCRAHGA